MTFIDFFTVLGSLSLFAMALALVPTLVVLIRVLRRLVFLLETVNRHIEPLSKSLTETATELQVLSLSLNDKVEKTDAIFDTVQKSANTLLMASRMLSDAVRPMIATVGGVGAGIGAFTRFLSERKTHY